MGVESLRALPIFNFVRMAYAVLIVTKLYISSKSPASQIGAVIEPETLKLGYYLEALIEKLGVAVGQMEFRAPFTFLGFFMRLQIWYKRQEQDVHFRPPTELYNVLDHCWLPVPPGVNKSPFAMNEPMYLEPIPSRNMVANQMGNVQSMGLSDLATMQPLLGELDDSQFLNFGAFDLNANGFQGDWSGMPNMTDLSMDSIMNDAQMAQSYSWNPQDGQIAFPYDEKLERSLQRT